MLVPVKWLSKYVDISDLELKQIEEKLILTGSNIEVTQKTLDGVQKIVVGRIEKIHPHPDADKLIFMDVNIGDIERIQIVTGATNCFEGAYVPVALHGSYIADGTKIKKGRIRGVKSDGMLCSLEELGFDKSVISKEFDDGILILNGIDGLELGRPIWEVEGLQDSVIEFEITPNRPDCLSMIGMARETAATFEKELKLPSCEINSQGDDIKNHCKLDVRDKDLCPRYLLKMVKNIKIEPSPLWMQFEIMKAGMRPINNIVDITNYVMLEMGQPIHAFDFDRINGDTIVVRRAKQDEIIKTLDENERKLNDEMLVIADSEKPQALAGIMGGAYAEIQDDTKTIVIEVANFDKTSIRQTSKELALRSESSSRFEKGVSDYFLEMTVNRICHLIEKLGAGEIVGGILDSDDTKKEKTIIKIAPERINKKIGIDITAVEMAKLLNRLEIETEYIDGEIVCHIPSFRTDLKEKHDIVEEVARLYGYDKIPMSLPKGFSVGAKTESQVIEDKIRETMFGCGINEITTYSFISPNAINMIKAHQNSVYMEGVKLLNPLGEEYSVMRTTLVPNILEVVARNFNRSIDNVKVFEIGNTFIPKQIPMKELPTEKKSMSIAILGKNETFFTTKGYVMEIINTLGIKDVKFVVDETNQTYHPLRCARIVYGEHTLGTIGEVHPTVLERYNIKERVYLAELDFELLINVYEKNRLYKPIPKFPAMTRDIALIVKEEILADEIVDIIKAKGGKILERVRLFDVYRGEQIEKGYKSLAYAMVFRHAEKTLTDDEVNKVFNKMLQSLETELDAKLR